MAHSVSLLHLSDLHFTADGIPEAAGRRGPEEVAKRMVGDRARQFRDDLKTTLHATTIDRWPKLVLVTGDLVNHGGGDRWAEAFKRAREFLEELARDLQIRPEQVYVVPGNHDADWSPGLTQPERFRRFTEAMAPFTTPRFDGSNPVAKLVTLPNLVTGVSIELLLLISPTFSGTADSLPKSMMGALCKLYPDASAEDLTRLEESLQSARGTLDIAALGPRQREQIREIARNDQPVRIALLHHHLLPHPEVASGPFEAVLDAGPVIDELMPRFDLALTGHKHTRRLLQLRKGNEFLDVYSGPSLFHGHEASASGFTIVDVHGSNGAYYATLHHWSTGGQREDEANSLIRRGRVDPKIADISAQVNPALQRKRLVPVLEHVTRSLQWSEGHAAKRLFDGRWKQLEKDMRRLGEQTLVFRPPNLSKHWGELLELAQHPLATLRLVSNQDLQFWVESLRRDTDADYYERHVRAFKGAKKMRVLILDRRDMSGGGADNVSRVSISMQAHGVEVMLAWSHEVPEDEKRDFGLIGDLAVSEFKGTMVTGRRLQEHFGKEKRRKAEDHWNTLMGLVRWRSEDEPFDAWFARDGIRCG